MAPPPASPPPSGPARGDRADAGASLRTVEVAQDRFGQQFKHLAPIPQELLAVGQAAPVDLFLPRLRHSEEGDELEAVCFLPAGRPLSPSQAQALRQAGLDFYYAPRDQMGLVLGFMAAQVQARLEDDSLPVGQKAHLVYEQASLLVDQALGSENLEENLDQGRDYVDCLHGFMCGGGGAPQSLAQMMVLDSGLMSHSVNVCLLTTGFAAHLRLPAPEARQMALGALYHDLGMRSIPQEVLKKPGALNREEWDLIRRHPQEGHDLLADQKALTPISLKMVLQHHENLDGSGYPHRRRGEDLEIGSRLLRLVDAYDAITGMRSFREARHAFEAVRIILEEMKEQVDLELLHDFVAFLGILAPDAQDHPQRKGTATALDGPQSGAKAGQQKKVHYTRSGRRIEV